MISPSAGTAHEHLQAWVYCRRHQAIPRGAAAYAPTARRAHASLLAQICEIRTERPRCVGGVTVPKVCPRNEGTPQRHCVPEILRNNTNNCQAFYYRLIACLD